MEIIEEITLRAPVPGTCPLCALAHEADHPHDRDSLYYLNWFFKRHNRFPTWKDAMAHCPEAIKAQAIITLAKRGVVIEND